MEQEEKNRSIDIDEIITIEWAMFQDVQNIGGRADCQDDWETFTIMRRSQYENWPAPMRQTYLAYLRRCADEERNLVSEKYGRMMAFTDPTYYQVAIAPFIPQVSDRAQALIDRIMTYLLPWEADFVRQYPKLAGVGRPVTTANDMPDFTSMETYSRGELATYPEILLTQYADYVEALSAEGRSLSVLIHGTVVRAYGYRSIAEAEAAIR